MAFKYKYDLDGKSEQVEISWPCADATVFAKGDLVAVASGLAVRAAAAAAAGTILGVATEDKANGGGTAIKVLVPTATAVFEVDWQAAGTKTTCANADLATAFDVEDHDNLNLDDTTGGFCKLVGFTNATKKALVTIGNRVFV